MDTGVEDCAVLYTAVQSSNASCDLYRFQEERIDVHRSGRKGDRGPDSAAWKSRGAPDSAGRQGRACLAQAGVETREQGAFAIESDS